MYKKITHNIVEEHFDSPNIETNSIKSTLGTQMSSNEFKTEVTNYFDSYNKKINKIIETTTDTEEAMVAAEIAAFENVDALGNLLKRVYSFQISESLTQNIRATILSIIQASHFLKIGIDIKNWANTRFDVTLSDYIARILRDANNEWDYQTVKDLYLKAITAWLAQIKARIAKNTALEQQQSEIARQALMTLADAIGTGVVKQHPELFLSTATMTFAKNSYQSDIM